MGDVLSFTGFAHAVALDRFCQDDGGLAAVLGCRRERGVNLVRVVSAAVESPDVFIGHIRHHGSQFIVLAKKVLPGIGAAFGFECLELTVHRFFHSASEQSLGVAHQQRVPVRTPDQLNDIPARASEITLEFLNDLAVAPYRAVKALQIAVDDKNQVVQFFPACERKRTDGFGFIHFTVSDKHPDFPVGRIAKPAIVEVFHKPGLVNRHDRTQPH